jgi:hypothetical protein
MIMSAGPSLMTRPGGRRAARRSGPRTAPREMRKSEVAAHAAQPFALETIGSHWQLALDAAQRALGAAGT